MEQENAQKRWIVFAEEKKWQAQLQLRRDQMAAATGGSLLYPL